jgi:hypothetical protein
MNFKEICKVVKLLNAHYEEDCLCVQIYGDGSGAFVDVVEDYQYFVFYNEKEFYSSVLELLEKDDLDPEARLLAIVNKET